MRRPRLCLRNINIQLLLSPHTHTHTHTRTHAHAHARAHTHTHTHMHTHTHTHVGFYGLRGLSPKHLNLALTGDGAFLFSLKKTHSVWFISILNYGDTENVLINHLLFVIPMLYPCHYTNLCPHKPHKHFPFVILGLVWINFCLKISTQKLLYNFIKNCKEMSINVELNMKYWRVRLYFILKHSPNLYLLFSLLGSCFSYQVKSNVFFLLLFTVACIKAALPKNMMLMFLMYYCNTDIFYLQKNLYFNIFFLFL